MVDTFSMGHNWLGHDRVSKLYLANFIQGSCISLELQIL